MSIRLEHKLRTTNIRVCRITAEGLEVRRTGFDTPSGRGAYCKLPPVLGTQNGSLDLQ